MCFKRRTSPVPNLKGKSAKNHRIDLLTDLESIFTSWQPREKLQCLYENLMSNNFREMAVLKTVWKQSTPDDYLTKNERISFPKTPSVANCLLLETMQVANSLCKDQV